MKRLREVAFECDDCGRNITGRKHIRIVVGFNSGLMVPPYIGHMPEIRMLDGNPERHFCKAECFTLFFTKKLHELRTNAPRNPRRVNVGSAFKQVLAEVSAERSPMSGASDVGTCDFAFRPESEREVGAGSLVRVGARGGSVSGRRGNGEEHQSVDCVESDHGLELGRNEIPAHLMEKRSSISEWFVRSAQAAKRGLNNFIP